MAKKKTTLSMENINSSPLTQEEKIESIKKQSSNDRKSVVFFISDNIKYRLDVYCAKNRLKKNVVIEGLIEKFLEEKENNETI